MYKSLRVVFATMALAAIAFAADNSIGTWKMDVAKSVQAPGLSPIKSLTVTRTAVAGGADTVVKGERADGTKIDSRQTLKYDGKEVALTGSGLPYDTISAMQVDANTFTDHRSKRGERTMPPAVLLWRKTENPWCWRSRARAATGNRLPRSLITISSSVGWEGAFVAKAPSIDRRYEMFRL